jgi:hypothetical protein
LTAPADATSTTAPPATDSAPEPPTAANEASAPPKPPVEKPAATDQGDKPQPEPDKKDPGASATDDTDKKDEDTEDEPLGPQGRRALDAWKARAKEAETADKAHAAQVALLEARIADFDKSPEEQVLLAARREGESAATATVTAAASTALAKQALITEAKGRLADPSDVTAFLDAADIQVGAGFSVDTAAITALVDDLLARKPHLAVPPPVKQGPVVPAGGIDQGVRAKDTPTLGQRAELAQTEGRHKDAIGYKTQELMRLMDSQGHR